jgi:hypothetical protein
MAEASALQLLVPPVLEGDIDLVEIVVIEIDDGLQFLRGEADASYVRAKAEDREKVPLRLTIDSWSY